MRYILFYISLHLAATWTANVAIAMEQEKRSTATFNGGARGQKTAEDTIYNGDRSETISPDARTNSEVNNDDNYVAKRVPSGFFGMRGKKPFDGWISPLDDEDIYKRVPTGFFGLRGKKDMDYGVDYEKRVPTGFFGLRGKKFYDYVDDDVDETAYYEKRVPSGFFGLRGKREFEDELEELDEAKRAAPENRFFGMRGKKQPSRSGFFGMRGKKYPYEFRGKFVGVRGKRLNAIGSPEYVNSEQVPRYGGDMDLNQLMLLLNEKGSDQLNK